MVLPLATSAAPAKPSMRGQNKLSRTLSLIAAAHAMYEALEGLLRAVDDGEAMDRVPFDDARAALKARGESP
jgi:hypothetical protein